MPASGDFDSTFEPDGTQASAPPPVYSDPTAGLAGGGAAVGFRDDWSEDARLEVAKPVEPDPAAVREAVAAALADERGGTAPERAPKTTSTAVRKRSGKQAAVRKRSGRQEARPAPAQRAGSPVRGTQAAERAASTPRRQTAGCVVAAVVVLVIVLFNVFSGLGDWISSLFH